MTPSPVFQVDTEYLVQLAQELIRYPSVNPPGDVVAITRRLALELRDLGLPVEELSCNPVKPNLVVRWTGQQAKPVLIFYAHTDVVPVEQAERERWICDPFGGELRDGVLYGRGAVDAKSKLAALLAAVRAVRQAGFSPRGELRLLIVADGEVGDREGLLFLSRMAPELLQGDMVVACEPSELKILRAFKGRMWVRVEISGHSGHALVPEHGINALEEALAILPELLATGRELASQEEELSPGDAEILGGGSCTLTTLRGGEAVNVMPGHCEATLDLRVPPGGTAAQALEALRARAAQLERERAGVRIQLSALEGSIREPYVVPADSPVVQALQRAYRKATGSAAEMGPGYSSGGLYHFHQLGVPGVYFGSGSIWNAHRENESVSVAELIAMASTYAQLVREVLGDE